MFKILECTQLIKSGFLYTSVLLLLMFLSGEACSIATVVCSVVVSVRPMNFIRIYHDRVTILNFKHVLFLISCSIPSRAEKEGDYLPI